MQSRLDPVNADKYPTAICNSIIYQYNIIENFGIKNMNDISNFEETLIPEYLVQTGVLTAEQLESASKYLDQYKKKLKINAYIVDQQNYCLQETDYWTGKVLHTITLPKETRNPPNFLSIDWAQIGSSNAIVFTGDKLRQLTELKWDAANEQAGLVLEDDKSYLYVKGKPLHYHAFVDTLNYEFIPLKKAKALPLDMKVVPGSNFLYVADRGLGKLHIIDLEKKKTVSNLVLRSPGAKKTFNIASLADNSKLLITDNNSPALFIVNQKSLKIKRQPLSYGVLGNIKLSHDNQWVYIISIRRGGFAEVLVLDTLNFILKTAIPLKGKIFSAIDDPYDIMALSPDNNWLLVMTYTDSPALFTPIINVINLNSYTIDDTIILDSENKPSIIAFGKEIPKDYSAHLMSITDVLLKLQMVTPEQINKAREEVISLEKEPKPPAEGPKREDYSFLKYDEIDPAILISFKQEDLSKWTFIPLNNTDKIFKVAVVDSENLEMRKFLQAKFEESILQFINIPQNEFDSFMKELYPFIRQKYLDILARLNMRQFDADDDYSPNGPASNIEVNNELPVPRPPLKLNLQSIPPEVIEREIITCFLLEFINIWNVEIEEQELLDIEAIKAAATKVRNELITFDYSLVNIPNMYKNYSLETVVSQEKLLERLSSSFQPVTPPPTANAAQKSACSVCGKEIAYGLTICNACSAQTVDNEHESHGIASLDPLSYLPLGHFLIIDTESQRVLELDSSLEILWQYGSKEQKGEPIITFAPHDAFRLGNGNTLIVDTGEDRIIEISKTGKIRWELNAKAASTELALQRPVKATKLINGHILIADQGHHRVFEINSLDKIVWQYGILNSVGTTDGRLYNPSDVQRLPNKHTLITDTDNHRVIELDEEDKIIWQYGNKDNKLGSGYGTNKNELNSPTQAMRLPNNNTLIVDSGNSRVIEVNSDKHILWCFFTKQDDGVLNFIPIRALRRDPGNTIIFGDQLFVEVDKTGALIYLKYYESLPYSPEYQEENKKATPSRDIASHVSKLAKEAAKDYIFKNELEDIEIPLVNKNNNRIFIVNRAKQILWRLVEVEENHPLRLERPGFCELLENGYMLITDSDRHRVMEIYRQTKEITWQYGITGAIGSGPNQLGYPRSITLTPDDTFIISDQHNSRVIEVNRDKEIIWSYGGWDDGISPINAPYYAQRTKDDTILITDWSNHVILEVTRDKEICWEYGTKKSPGSDFGELMYPESAIRLENGNTLICDTRNNRVLEVKPDMDMENVFGGDTEENKELNLNNPTSAYRTQNGNTLIVSNNNKNVYELTPEKKIIWKYELKK